MMVVEEAQEEVEDADMGCDGERQSYNYKGAVLSEKRKRDSFGDKVYGGSKRKGVVETKSGHRNGDRKGNSDQAKSEPSSKSRRVNNSGQQQEQREDQREVERKLKTVERNTEGSEPKLVRKAMFQGGGAIDSERIGVEEAGQGPLVRSPQINQLEAGESDVISAAVKEEEEYRKLVMHYEGTSATVEPQSAEETEEFEALVTELEAFVGCVDRTGGIA